VDGVGLAETGFFLVVGTFCVFAGCLGGWRSSCGEGWAVAEGVAVDVAVGLDWAEAVGLGDETAGGPELTVRFTAVPRSILVPSG
jgi:hypothetical protein